MSDLKAQVEKSHYDFNHYVSHDRWMSYYNQVDEVNRCNPKSVLVVGPGDNIVVNLLKTFSGDVKTLGIDESLNPDYLKSVYNLDEVIDRKFDVVLCCQVLEHLPFDQFEESLKKLLSITTDRLIIALPEKSARVAISMKLPKLKMFFFYISIPLFWVKHKFDGEHYWELHSAGFKPKRVKNIMKSHAKLEKYYRLKSNPYHHFFILRPR